MSDSRKKPCWSCGREIFLKEAAETRTLYPGNKDERLCKDCMRRKLDERIAETRARMGLPPRILGEEK